MALTVLVVLLQLAAAAGNDAPALFREPLFPSAVSKIALQSSLQLPEDLELPGTPYIKPSQRRAAIPQAPAPTEYNLNLVYVDYDLIASMPQQLQLTLPGMAAPMTAVRRPDVAALPHVWIGELASAPGAQSTVVLVLSKAVRMVTGNVHFIDTQINSMKSFLITPAVFGSSNGTGGGASSSAVVAAAAISSATSAMHVVVQHQGQPERPECFPERLLKRLKAQQPKHMPRVKTDSQGRPVVLQMQRRAGFTNGPGKTAIKLASTSGSNRTATAQDGSSVASESSAGRSRRRLQQAQKVKQTLLILYTDAAAAGANGPQQLENQADSAVAMMNKAYADSGIDIVTTKIGFKRVLYTEPSPSDDSAGSVLSAVTNGDIANVFQWRNELGADLVALFNNDNTVCGIAWMPPSQAGGPADDESQGFAAIMRGCWYSATLAHEIGHVHGCNHDYDTDWKAGTTYYPQYAHGYKNCAASNIYSTILSYGRCSTDVAPRLFRFSNPALKTEDGSPVGDATNANCARKHMESAAAIAAYRPDGGVITSCKPTEKQCKDTMGNVKCLSDASMCCASPYLDDCPFFQTCNATSLKCTDKCNAAAGLKYCASANKCVASDGCCPGNVNDCPSPFSCPGPGQQCVCNSNSSQCGCPAGTVECGAGCIQEGTCCAQPDSCPAGQACDGDGGSCYDLCPQRYKVCGKWCIKQQTCCPDNPGDCPDPFYCPPWELDSSGVPKYTTNCGCTKDAEDLNACCDAGYKACQGGCIPEASCCTWPETCGYESYCAESGTDCVPYCSEGATYCEGMCYWPFGVDLPVCCKSNPAWKSQCKAPFSVCPGNGKLCTCPGNLKKCGKSCYNPKTNCCYQNDCNIKTNFLCILAKGKEIGKCTQCKSGTKACSLSYSCIANNKKCT